MFNRSVISNQKGVTLIELMIVIAIIAILASIGIPQYGRFTSRSSVKRAANDLSQNMRLARTMAIKENRQYLITFNEGGANNYRIGFDGNSNNSLVDVAADGYGTGPVRLIDLQNDYGNNVAFGTAAATGPDQPAACPACIGIVGSTVSFSGGATEVQTFNTDGSVGFTGSAFITHTGRGYTYMLRISFQSGKTDLWSWDGENDILTPPTPVSCTTSPVRYCGWTEIR